MQKLTKFIKVIESGENVEVIEDDEAFERLSKQNFEFLTKDSQEIEVNLK
jgi:hypothetical protein